MVLELTDTKGYPGADEGITARKALENIFTLCI